MTFPRFAAAALVALATTGCIQSVHGDGPSGPPPPGGVVRLLEEQTGRGRLVAPGDRVRVDLVGKYASGEVWAEGPLTFIVGSDTYPIQPGTLRVGSVIRMQYVTNPSDTTSRLWPFQGLDWENEAFQMRRDRGAITMEHTVRKACRPMKLYLMNTGFGPIEASLGCWPIFRSGARGRQADLERRIYEIDSGTGPPNPEIEDPAPALRPAADTLRYLGDDGLHLAAREGRPEIVGWLIGRGRDPEALDSFGFAPVHYVGYAQLPNERFVPALERSYVDVLDTLIAHDAEVDVRVGPGKPMGFETAPAKHEGASALGFAASSCADELVARLLEAGADPDVIDFHSTPALTAAVINGCPETVGMLLEAGANVEMDPIQGGTPTQRLGAVGAFHLGHLKTAELLIEHGGRTSTAIERLQDRLDDPGPGGFGFSNRPMARRILDVYKKGKP